MVCLTMCFTIRVDVAGVYTASKGLTAAVLNTSKLFEEIGDLYAKQVSIVTCGY